MDRQALHTRVLDAIKGLKTLITAAVLVALGLAQELQAIDLKPFFTLLFGEDVATKLMIVLPVVFIVLRAVSTSPIRMPWRHKDQDPF